LSPFFAPQRLERSDGGLIVTFAPPGNEPVSVPPLTFVAVNWAFPLYDVPLTAPSRVPFHDTERSAVVVVAALVTQLSGLVENDPVTFPLVIDTLPSLGLHPERVALTTEASLPPPMLVSGGEKDTFANMVHVSDPGASPANFASGAPTSARPAWGCTRRDLAEAGVAASAETPTITDITTVANAKRPNDNPARWRAFTGSAIFTLPFRPALSGVRPTSRMGTTRWEAGASAESLTRVRTLDTVNFDDVHRGLFSALDTQGCLHVSRV